MENTEKKTRTALPIVTLGIVYIICMFLLTFLIHQQDRPMERNLGTTPMIPGESEHSTTVK